MYMKSEFFLDLSSPALALDMFQWWDLKESKMNTGVLIVQGSYINWHSFNGNLSYENNIILNKEKLK